MSKSTKTTRIIIQDWWGAIEFCERTFGPAGVQQDRRWFYRLFDQPEEESMMGRKVRRSRRYYNCYLYFRDARDATFFALAGPAQT